MNGQTQMDNKVHHMEACRLHTFYACANTLANKFVWTLCSLLLVSLDKAAKT